MFVDFDIWHWMASLRNYTLWPWPTFGGNKFETLISETVIASEKMHETTFEEFDICLSSRVNIVIIVLHDLYLLFKGKKFEMFISLKRWKLAQKCLARVL